MPPPSPLNPSTSSASGSIPMRPTDSGLLRLWLEAIDKLKTETHMQIVFDHHFDSPQAIYDLVDKSTSTFADFRHGRQKWIQRLRDKIEPVALIVQTLSGALGDAVTLPFSPMKAVFGVIGVVIEASMKVKETFNDILDAFDSIKHYLRTITPLASGAMHDALRDASVALLAQILKVLITIRKVQKDGRMKQLLKQLCQTKEVSETLEELERLAGQHHQTVSAATLVAVTDLMARLSNIITSDRGSAESCLEQMKAIGQSISTMIVQTASSSAEQLLSNHRVLERMEANLLQAITAAKSKRREMAEVYKWLSYQDSSARVNDLLDTRISGTGSWFLQHPDFQAFLSGDIRVLWLHGSAGSGKSTIMAMTSRHLIARSSIANEGRIVMMHFFDATSGSQSRHRREFVCSLICQLADATDECQHDLIKLHDTHKCGYSHPTTEHLRRQLDQLLESASRPVTIVIDALDEAKDGGTILLLLQELCNDHRGVSLFVSSRTEVPYRESLSNLSDRQLALRGELVEGDITILLNSRLAPINDSDAELVRKTLRDGSEGNFRWTILQAAELAPVAEIPVLLRAKLQSMPQELKDIYDRAARSIQPELLETARRLLAWLTFAQETLTREQFVELLAFDFPTPDGLPKFDAKLRASSPDAVLSILSSTFISFRDKYVHISHNSVKDYLLDPESALHIDARSAHLTIMQMCLAYLTAASPSGPWDDDSLPWHYSLDYALYSWSFHANELQDLEGGSLGPKESVAAYIGNCSGGPGADFLARAIGHKHTYAARILIDCGVNVNDAKDSDWPWSNPLCTACFNAPELVPLLLKRGADANGCNSLSLSPLHAAALMHREDTVALLLEAGADVVALDYNDWSPLAGMLYEAGEVLNGKFSLSLSELEEMIPVAHMLIKKGASLDQYNDHNDSLHHYLAVSVFKGQKDYDEAMQILKSLEVDLRAVHSLSSETLLHYLADGRRVPPNTTDRLLRDGLIDVNAKNISGETALHIVCEYLDSPSDSQFLRSLLEAGANPYICDDWGELPKLPDWATGLVKHRPPIPSGPANGPTQSLESNPVSASPNPGPSRMSIHFLLSEFEPQPSGAKDMDMEVDDEDPSDVESSSEDRPWTTADMHSATRESSVAGDESPAKDISWPAMDSIEHQATDLVERQESSSAKRAREDDSEGRPPMSHSERERREAAFERSF